MSHTREIRLNFATTSGTIESNPSNFLGWAFQRVLAANDRSRTPWTIMLQYLRRQDWSFFCDGSIHTTAEYHVSKAERLESREQKTRVIISMAYSVQYSVLYCAVLTRWLVICASVSCRCLLWPILAAFGRDDANFDCRSCDGVVKAWAAANNATERASPSSDRRSPNGSCKEPWSTRSK